MRNNYLSSLVLFVGILLVAGCIKDLETLPDERSGLTVVNSFLEAEAVFHRLDVGRGFQQLNRGLGYRSIDYYSTPGCENCRMEITALNGSRPLVDTSFVMETNKYYTSFLFGSEAAPKHFLTIDSVPEDDNTPSESAGLRFFNLAETAKRVTLHIGSATPMPAFRNRPTETPETGRESGEFFLTTDTGTHVLTIEDEQGNLLARRTGVALDWGDYLTVFLTGNNSESSPYYIGIVRHQGVN